MFSNSLVAQFTDTNPRFIVYRDTDQGRVPVATSNHQLQAWSMAEDVSTGQEAVIFDKLANFGNGATRTRLRLTPQELAQRIKR